MYFVCVELFTDWFPHQIKSNEIPFFFVYMFVSRMARFNLKWIQSFYLYFFVFFISQQFVHVPRRCALCFHFNENSFNQFISIILHVVLNQSVCYRSSIYVPCLISLLYAVVVSLFTNIISNAIWLFFLLVEALIDYYYYFVAKQHSLYPTTPVDFNFRKALSIYITNCSITFAHSKQSVFSSVCFFLFFYFCQLKKLEIDCLVRERLRPWIYIYLS